MGGSNETDLTGVHPFSIMPDARLFYRGRSVRACFDSLLTGVLEHQGMMLLVGEAGMGKTTLLLNLQDALEEAGCLIVYPRRPMLSFDELIETCCQAAGIDGEEVERIGKVHAFTNLLIRQVDDGSTTAILIDDAQAVSDDFLISLARLTNIRKAGTRLLQVILAGQPVLVERLSASDQPFVQDCAIAYRHLEALGKAEIKDYIGFRLDRVGHRGPLFTAKAVKRIGLLSAGVPQVINQLCGVSLELAGLEESPKVSQEQVDAAADDLFSGDESAAPSPSADPAPSEPHPSQEARRHRAAVPDQGPLEKTEVVEEEAWLEKAFAEDEVPSSPDLPGPAPEPAAGPVADPDGEPEPVAIDWGSLEAGLADRRRGGVESSDAKPVKVVPLYPDSSVRETREPGKAVAAARSRPRNRGVIAAMFLVGLLFGGAGVGALWFSGNAGSGLVALQDSGGPGNDVSNLTEDPVPRSSRPDDAGSTSASELAAASSSATTQAAGPAPGEATQAARTAGEEDPAPVSRNAVAPASNGRVAAAPAETRASPAPDGSAETVPDPVVLATAPADATASSEVIRIPEPPAPAENAPVTSAPDPPTVPPVVPRQKPRPDLLAAAQERKRSDGGASPTSDASPPAPTAVPAPPAPTAVPAPKRKVIALAPPVDSGLRPASPAAASDRNPRVAAPIASVARPRATAPVANDPLAAAAQITRRQAQTRAAPDDAGKPMSLLPPGLAETPDPAGAGPSERVVRPGPEPEAGDRIGPVGLAAAVPRGGEAGAEPYRLQFASLASRSDAERERARLVERHSDILGVYDLTITKGDVEGRDFYRVRSSPLDDGETAYDTCVEMANRGQDCMVLRGDTVVLNGDSSVKVAGAIGAVAAVEAAAASSGAAFAPQGDLTVLDFVVSREVEDREPVGKTSVFSAGERLGYAFARVRNLGAPAKVEFLWRRDDRLISRYRTTIGSSVRWRTWSQAELRPGAWRVTLVEEDGEVLAQAEFLVE